MKNLIRIPLTLTLLFATCCLCLGQEFYRGEIDVLVATVVIEVGINVPNASVIVIENAERFGLAQLHQLRGRVGRGRWQSYCFLITQSQSELAQKRGEIMQSSSDGFFIAEEDMKLRGPGDIFGTRQHGIPELNVADLAKHLKIMEAAGLFKRERVGRRQRRSLRRIRFCRKKKTQN